MHARLNALYLAQARSQCAAELPSPCSIWPSQHGGRPAINNTKATSKHIQTHTRKHFRCLGNKKQTHWASSIHTSHTAQNVKLHASRSLSIFPLPFPLAPLPTPAPHTLPSLIFLSQYAARSTGALTHPIASQGHNLLSQRCLVGIPSGKALPEGCVAGSQVSTKGILQRDNFKE